jgi:hypothetical protein
MGRQYCTMCCTVSVINAEDDPPPPVVMHQRPACGSPPGA